MRIIILICLLATLAIFLVGCQELIPEYPAKEPAPIEPAVEEIPEPVEEQIEEQPAEELEVQPVEEPVEVDLSCTNNADCEWNEKCIDGECGTVAALYETECDKKCNYNGVVIKTSDDETYTLSRGKGSYSYAGAIAWTLMGGPDYCPMENVPVPIKVEKVTTGKVLSEEVITLRVGETSGIVKHPSVKRVAFTMKLESINEECS